MKLIILISSIIIIGCSSSQTSSNASTPVKSVNNFSTDNPAMSLADYLKRVPGVQIVQSGTRTKVVIRGQNSLSENNEPLFVINNVNVGFGYDNAEPLVSVTDIESVQVLKSGQETAPYGMQGNSGVIKIKTKGK